MASVRKRTAKGSDVATWQVLFRHHGTQKSKTFVTEKAADDFADLIRILGADRALASLAVQPTGMTLDELAEKFFDWKATEVTPRTLADYRRDYANWIRPTLGHRVAETIDETDVQALVDDMAKRLDPKSVKDRHMILGSIYRYGAARSRQLVPHNPCQETRLPKLKKKPVKGATLPEWLAIYPAAQRIDTDAADLLLFMASTGWRFSEATAVNVGALEDYGDPEVYISVRRVTRRDADQRFVIAEDQAKSFAGIRRIRVSPACAAMLRRRAVGKGPDDLLLTNSHGRRWHQTNFLNRTWTAILEEAGLERRITPHALRHAHVALLNRSGVSSMAEIKRRLGHEDIKTTINTYGGMIDDVRPEALATMDALLMGQVVSGEVVAGDVVRELT